MIPTIMLGGLGLAGVGGNGLGPQAPDPYWSSVVLLCPFDGANGATTTTDISISGHTMTHGGTSYLGTARPKFGTACMETAGAGWFACSASNDFNFGSGAFTIEGFFQVDSVTGTHALIGYANGSAQNSNYEFQLVQSGANLSFSVFNGNTQFTASKSGIVLSQTHHFACVSNGTAITAYLDGVAGTPTSTGGVTLNALTSPTLQIGQVQTLAGTGMLDELRITKGVARTITVPTQPYPNF